MEDKTRLHSEVKWTTLLLLILLPEINGLEYASYYQDHMVLQRAPQKALIWGYGRQIGDQVTVEISKTGSVHTRIIKNTNGTGGVWQVKLPAVSDTGPFIITASSQEGNVSIHDVLFGDVWMCPGQTDMAFPMSQITNSTNEIKKAMEYKHLRVLKPKDYQSATALDDLKGIDINWTTPSNASLGNFSAVCWLFGEYLYSHTKHPIGLIQVTFPEATHSSPERKVNNEKLIHFPRIPPIDPGSWNGLIYPLSHMVTFGIIWYQGSGNLKSDFNYGYDFIVMMSNMRTLYRSKTLNETSSSMPFGIVQMGPITAPAYASEAGSFRWSQSFDYGVVPNGRQTDAFMAITADLIDPHSPYGQDHPRCKQIVSARLMLGALNIAYGDKDIEFQGPYPNNITFVKNVTKLMRIQYDQVIVVRSRFGFEFCCSNSSSEKCYDTDKHIPAPILFHDETSVTISYAGCGSDWVVGISYDWSGSPCEAYQQCAIYSRASGLPAPLYINGWPWYTRPN
ncbi:sialate O-acetylesterase-like isoform X2 [Haliotis rufescens]|uniref:sialate O-acetylesterase-like isoform X2 n=1 Tax=Haliotis rufescens TaxID=6454 RepID=UPI00201F0BB8|nr:sialate O-acetylesterase-like isoform X2 [Haliotis rufescens]